MKNINKKGFTLVELIVVIIILAILGTIAFISLQGYSASARNSKRISDINNIKTGLALFNTRVGMYPEPDNITDVIYRGAMVWSQGEVGENVTRNLKELPKIPLDPLIEKPYVYSLLNTKKEYEVGCIFETDPNSITMSIGNEVNAANKRYYAYIKGDYNGKVAKVSTGSVLYVFAVPSIIGAGLSDPNIEEIIRKKELVYNGYQNIPANYSGGDITMTGSFEFGGDSLDILVYSGSIEDLSQSYESLLTFGTNLQKAYSGTILSNDSSYKNITLMNLEDSDSLREIAGGIVKENLGGEIAPAVECADKPSYTHTNFIAGTVLVDGTPRQNTSSSNPCYYECTDGYHGNQCEIAPVCATKPSYSNTNFVDGTVLVDGTPRQNDFPSNPCYYECTGGYSGDQCDIGTCAAQTHGTTNTSYTTGNPTSIGVARQKTNSGNSCYYTCINGYGGVDCDLYGWRLLDSNCKVNDIVVGTQTWAGCNSTLGTGVEYTSGRCFTYNWGFSPNDYDCYSGYYGDSNDSELAYFEYIYGVGGTTPGGDKGIDNIWGKFYTRANAFGACPTGRHLPTKDEWQTLIAYVDANNGNTTLGWLGHSSQSSTGNLINLFKLPVSGIPPDNRGRISRIRSSTPYDNGGGSWTRARTLQFRVYENGVSMVSDSWKTEPKSVRCIKN